MSFFVYYVFIHTLYILHSETLSRYYVGESINSENRLTEHNYGKYQRAFTKSANDWALVLGIECSSRTQALKIEAHIKSMKSKIYIENLIKYEEMRVKLLKRFES